MMLKFILDTMRLKGMVSGMHEGWAGMRRAGGVLALWIGLGIWPGCALAHAHHTPRLVYVAETPDAAEGRSMAEGAAHITAWYREVGCTAEFGEVKVRLYTWFPAYKAYQRAHSGTRSNRGFYSDSTGEVVIARNELTVQTFLHEFNHRLMRACLKDPPNWLNEGLSEYFEGLRPDGGGLRSAPQAAKMARLGQWAGGDVGRDIDWLLSVPAREWSERNRGADRKSSTLSYGVVHYLLSREDGRRVLASILAGLATGHASREAVERAYPGGVAALGADLARFYGRAG